ncbi:MAG: NAD(P)H-binding protein [Pseudomonadota bacterium]
MNIIVFGGAGVLGRAITDSLRQAGHSVTTAGRSGCDVAVDFRYDTTPEAFAELLQGANIVVNAVGVLIERGDNRFASVHVSAPAALFAACAKARVARIVHISALGVGTGIPGAYMASKLAAEQALQANPVDYAIVRPALLVDDASPSTRLFKFLASLPVIGLPGLLHPGASRLAPIRVQDVAQAVANLCKHPKALRRTIELAGPETLSYRDLLAGFRRAAGKGPALWLPTPWWLMHLSAWLAAYLPQNNVFSRDTVRMLQAQCLPAHNAASSWLGHMPEPVLALVQIKQDATNNIAI